MNSRTTLLIILAVLGTFFTPIMGAIPDSVIMSIPDGTLTDFFDPSAADAAFQRDESIHCFAFGSDGKPNYVYGTAQGFWYFEGPIHDGEVNVIPFSANSLSFDGRPVTGFMYIKYAADYLSATEVSFQATNCEMCSSWPTTMTSGKALPASSLGPEKLCFYNSTAAPGTPTDLLSKWDAVFGTTYMCANPTDDNPMAVNGSWIYINQPSDCASRNEKYPCPNNYGPYNNGQLMTMPSGKGLVVTSWSGWGFPETFVWKGQKGWVNGRTIFAATTSTYVAGVYCVYDNDKNTIMFCQPEEYALNVGPSDKETCESQWKFPAPAPTPGTGIPDSVIMSIPKGALTDFFDPSAAGAAFQRDESIHCFAFGSDGKPNYVYGTAQGFWYFEGPIHDGEVNVIPFSANSLSFDGRPVTGFMYIKYAADYLSATEVSFQATNCEMCSSWPTTMTSGKALPASSLGPEKLCFYNSTAAPGTPTDLLSKWDAVFGTTYMCANPTDDNPMAVNGSWIYINQPSDCASRNEKYPCPNNYGPYNNGQLMTMPSGKGLVVTSWSGWGFPETFVWKGQKGWVNGRTIFAATTSTYVAGVYCVYDNDKNTIMFCQPEEYALNVGPSDKESCESQWKFPAPAPTGPPSGSSSSSSSGSSKLTSGQVAGIVIGVIIGLLLLVASFFFASKKSTKARAPAASASASAAAGLAPPATPPATVSVSGVNPMIDPSRQSRVEADPTADNL